MKRDAETGMIPSGVTRCVLAGMAAIVLAGCNQDQKTLPAKPTQGSGAAPAGNQASGTGVPGGGAGVAADRLVEKAPVNDGALADKVKTSIVAEPMLRSMALDVTAQDGVVTLHGTAATDAERERAAQVALGVAGVRSVNNQLVIVRGS